MATNDDFDMTMLRTLQPGSHLELLDIIDKLRAEGLNEHIDLPQLIVCGDQSSGKSSVLAAISGVPFPKKDNLCTRFATEVVLRRDDLITKNKVSVTITPSSTRPHVDRLALDAFARELTSMADLPSTIAEASASMGLGVTGSAFSADILRLEVRGPHMPQLTIVDLPGLVHSENKFQSTEDIVLVNTLVEEYMMQERSIILAVVSAKNDYANQIVLSKTRKIDPRGRRTLGIITKPDTLHPGSAGESSFLDLARNQDIGFSLGWHVVRNQDSNQLAEHDRDDLELDFFKTSRFSQIHQSNRGIVALRQRLSEVLFQQIKRELPSLLSEIASATDQTRALLARIGRSRATLLEKRIFVMDVGQKFDRLCFAACEGLYEDSFFEELGHSTPARRLRAVIQNTNIEFANHMLGAPPHLPAGLDGQHGESAPLIIQRAKALISSYRGKELPGTFNPLLVGQLFRELSTTWLKKAREHVGSVWISARATVVEILDVLTEENVRDACLKRVIDPELARMQQDMENQLDEYMLEFRRHPITYNHYLTETVHAIRHKRDRAAAHNRCHQLFATRDRLTSNDIDLIVSTITPKNEANMDAVAAQDLADYAEAYYKVALKRFIDEVPAHVIEPGIFARLSRIFHSSKILEMSDELIEDIGGESDERKTLRESLQAKLTVFDRSCLICKIYAERNPGSNDSRLSTENPTPATASTFQEDATTPRLEEDESVDEQDLEVGCPAAASELVSAAPETMDDLWPSSSKKVKKAVRSYNSKNSAWL